MDVELRTVTPDEVPSFIRAVESGFGEPTPRQEETDYWASLTEIDRTIAATSNGEIVGTASAFTFELTVPGPALLGAAGVTAVTVRTDARRQGVLTRMMGHQLADVADRGEAVAILTASEAAIYGRFGYGLASFHAEAKVDSDRAVLRADAPSGGRVRMVSGEEAARLLPSVHDRVRRQTVGDLGRTDNWWKHWFLDPRDERRPSGAPGRFHAVHVDAKGRVDGYTAYRVIGEWVNGHPAGRVTIAEMVTESPAAYADLWRHLLSVDLTRSVQATVAADEPIRWMLTDARQFATTRLQDCLWMRVLDVPAALSGRSYGIDASLVIEVIDIFGAGWAGGKYELKASTSGGSCRRVRSKPDITMGVAELGAIYLGGVRPSVLGRAGRVVEHRAGAFGRADAMFASPSAPFTRTEF